MEEVEVVIQPDGKVKVQVRGVKGGGCRGLTAAFERAVGAHLEVRETTAEAFERPAVEDGRGLKLGG